MGVAAAERTAAREDLSYEIGAEYGMPYACMLGHFAGCLSRNRQMPKGKRGAWPAKLTGMRQMLSTFVRVHSGVKTNEADRIVAEHERRFLAAIEEDQQ